MDLLRDLVHQRSMIAMMATHDVALIDRADRGLELRDGHLYDAAAGDGDQADGQLGSRIVA